MSNFPHLIAHPIPRVSAKDLTPETFRQYFVKQNLPVIVTDALDHWYHHSINQLTEQPTNQSANQLINHPADNVTNDSNDWTLEKLQSLIGTTVMNNVFQSYNGRYKYFDIKKSTNNQSISHASKIADEKLHEPNQSRLTMTFNEFIEKAKQNPPVSRQSVNQSVSDINESINQLVYDISQSVSGRPSYYLYSAQLPNQLVDRLSPPSLLPHDQSNDQSINPLTSSLLWVSINGSISPLHYDLSDGFLGQLIGSKHFTLIDPSVSQSTDDESLLKPHPVGHPHARQSSLTMPPLSQRFQSNSQSDNQSIDCFEGIVGPGELIYLPYAWWHQVESPSQSTTEVNQSISPPVSPPVSVSITYRFNQSARQSSALQSVALTEHALYKASLDSSIIAPMIASQLIDSLADCATVVSVMYMLRSQSVNQFVEQKLIPSLPDYSSINDIIKQTIDKINAHKQPVNQSVNPSVDRPVSQSNNQSIDQSLDNTSTQSAADRVIDCAKALYRQGCDEHAINRAMKKSINQSINPSIISTAEVQNQLIDCLIDDPLMKAYPTNEHISSVFWRTLLSFIDSSKLVPRLALQLKEANQLIDHNDINELDDGVVEYQRPWFRSYEVFINKSITTFSLRVERGFLNNIGLVQWPGGYLLSDYVLSTIDQSVNQSLSQSANMFHGRRVVELGAGIGLTSILIGRLIDCSIVCTDFESKVLNNILFNMKSNLSTSQPIIPSIDQSLDQSPSQSVIETIEEYDDWSSRVISQPITHSIYHTFNQPINQSVNQSINQWSVTHIDWTKINQSFLDDLSIDCIIAAETTYIPELLVPFAMTVACILRLAQKRQSINQSINPSTNQSINQSMNQSIKQPFAILCQTERHPLFFIEYLTALRDEGLRVEEITIDDSIPQHFIYDREGIFMHRVTLADQ